MPKLKSQEDGTGQEEACLNYFLLNYQSLQESILLTKSSLLYILYLYVFILQILTSVFCLFIYR